MFCRKKKVPKKIYLGMTNEEYLGLSNHSILEKMRREKARKKIVYIAHASWEDIGIKKSRKEQKKYDDKTRIYKK